MSWVSERHLVSAISNAGGFGVIACGSMKPELLAAEIAGTQALTAKPFGVNLITMHPQLDDLVRVCLEAKVSHIVLAGGIPPGAAVQAVKDGGAKLIASPRRWCWRAAWSARAPMRIVIEGSEAGGHIGPVSLTVLAQEILPHIARGAGVRRRRTGPRRGDPGLSGNGRVGRAARHAVRRGEGIRSRMRTSRRPSSAPMPATRCRRSAGRALSGHPGARAGQRRAPRRFLRHQAETRDQFQAGELTKEAAQLAIEHFWAGALRRAVIDGDVEMGSVMAGQSVGMVTAEAVRSPRSLQELVEPGHRRARRPAPGRLTGVGRRPRTRHHLPGMAPAGRTAHGVCWRSCAT